MSASSFISPQHEAARNWAAKGFPVFPWEKRKDKRGILGKMPNVKDWENTATVCADTIDQWWQEWPSAGIGCPPARLGCFVLDIDDKNGKSGTNSLMALEMKNATLPSTMENMTATGGRHMWFKGEARNSVSGIGEGLDIRGKGGWAALPDGVKYIELVSGEIVDAPEWFLNSVQNIAREHEERTIDKQIDEDLDVNIMVATRRLQDLVARGDVAIKDDGANDRTYRLAQELQDLGISPSKSLELIEDNWNPHGSHPWNREQLQQIIDNATAYRQNDSGVKGLDASGSTFAGIVVPKGGGPSHEQELKPSRFKPLSESEQDDMTEPPWLIPGWLPHGSTAIIYGEPGSYKSFLSVDAALSISAGVPAWGVDKPADEGPLPTLYIAGEGVVGIAKKRRLAWREHNGIKDPLPFWIVPAAPLVREPETFVEMMGEIEKVCAGQLPRLIVIDTMSRMMAGTDENSTQDASRAMEMADGLARRYNAAVLIVHHKPKDGSGPRGSGVFSGNPDVLLDVVADKDNKMVTLKCVKQKDAEEPPVVTFKLKPVASSVVLVRTQEKPSFVSADSQMKMDIARVLREAGAYGLGSALTTSALADSMAADYGEEGDPTELRKRISSQLRAFSKKKSGQGYVLPHSNPLMWALPVQDISA